MSYSEQDGQVVLSMSREDYDYLVVNLQAFGIYSYEPEKLHKLLDRLNSGNPHYTPYQVEKSTGTSSAPPDSSSSPRRP